LAQIKRHEAGWIVGKIFRQGMIVAVAALGLAGAAQAARPRLVSDASLIGGGDGERLCLISLDKSGDEPDLQLSCGAMSALSGITAAAGDGEATLRLMAARPQAIARAVPYLRQLSAAGMKVGLLSLDEGKKLVAYVVVPASSDEDIADMGDSA